MRRTSTTHSRSPKKEITDEPWFTEACPRGIRHEWVLHENMAICPHDGRVRVFRCRRCDKSEWEVFSMTEPSPRRVKAFDAWACRNGIHRAGRYGYWPDDGHCLSCGTWIGYVWTDPPEAIDSDASQLAFAGYERVASRA
jgi:hypothetical protein